MCGRSVRCTPSIEKKRKKKKNYSIFKTLERHFRNDIFPSHKKIDHLLKWRTSLLCVVNMRCVTRRTAEHAVQHWEPSRLHTETCWKARLMPRCTVVWAEIFLEITLELNYKFTETYLHNQWALLRKEESLATKAPNSATFLL